MAQGLANRARLGIPKVNQHPKLANRIAAPKSMSAKAFSGGKPAGQGSTYTAGAPGSTSATSASGSGMAQLAQGFNSFSLPAQTSTSAPVVAPAPAPAASTERFAIPTWSANPNNPGEQDPRDSSYWANLAKLRFNDEQEYRQNNEGEQKENADYNYALQQAIQGRKVQERQLGENAISGNLSASGWLDRTQGEQETAYTGERSHALFSHEHELHAFNAAKHALEEGWGIDAAAELGEAVGRRTERERKAAEEGAGETDPGPGSDSSSGSSSAPKYPASASPGEQIARGFTHVAVANNKPVGAPQQATAFAEALKKGKKK